jgi:hypothetical protein
VRLNFWHPKALERTRDSGDEGPFTVGDAFELYLTHLEHEGKSFRDAKTRLDSMRRHSAASPGQQLAPHLQGKCNRCPSEGLLDSPHLILRAHPDKDDPNAHMTHEDFVDRANKAANDKARKLGWIV